MRFRHLFLMIVLVSFGCGVPSTNNTDAQPNSAATNRESTNLKTAETPGPQNVSDTETTPGGIYIIFDSSGSMWGQLPDRSTKLTVAKKVLNDFVGGDFAGFDLALRVYGHRKKDDCLDSELVVPFGKPAEVVQPMRDFVGKVNALGRTPITYSLEKALEDFGSRSGEIILITDGIESCDADPCALIRKWRETNVKIKVHVVGFGLDEKSKDALKCLSEAAGTDYQDAQTAKDLADALKRIRERAATNGLILKGFDQSGKEVSVHGTLSRNGTASYKISSNSRYQIEAGEYDLAAGVQTLNGNLYRPVSQKVSVSGNGETLVKVTVALPPRVRAKFQDTQAEQQRGSMISVWQDGKEIGRFRPIDEVFLDEGNYEFRANPRDAGEISVNESFSVGDRKEIKFELARTVRVFVKFTAAEIELRQNAELWQNGVKKIDVHQVNGALVPPGTYDVRFRDELIPFEQSGVVIANKSPQTVNVEISAGSVTVIYQRSDGSRDKDDRVFLSRAGKNQNIFKMSGARIPLTAGSYQVKAWRQKGNYEVVSFEVAVGENKQIILRAR